MFKKLIIFIYSFLAFFIFSCAFASVINHESFYSNSLQKDMEYNVYLPDNYGRNIKYPVVYLLHGAGGNENDWVIQGNIQNTTDKLIKGKLIPPLIIVMPNGYTDSWYVDSDVYKMESAIVDDLIPFIEGKFQIDKKSQYIAGLSMGGYGSLRFVLLYPNYFKGAGLLSPAIYDPVPPINSSARSTPVFFNGDKFDGKLWEKYNYTNYLDEYLHSNNLVPMYIVSGDDDVYNVEYYATLLYEKLKANKKPSELRIVNGGHTWDVWKDNIDEVLIYLFNNKNQTP
jgi:enterochelin esterase-like enzyme